MKGSNENMCFLLQKLISFNLNMLKILLIITVAESYSNDFETQVQKPSDHSIFKREAKVGIGKKRTLRKGKKVRKKKNKTKSKSKKGKQKTRSKKKKPSGIKTENRAEEKASYKGPYGFEHPDAFDWTQPQFLCPNCEDTLIVYDPWWGPPPELHIPIVCTSNLSDFSKSTSLTNFGPNLTIIFIPGSINCPDQTRARQVNTKQFGLELSQDTDEVDSSPASNTFDCGQSVSPNDNEISCGEHATSYTKNPGNNQCLWHFNAYEGWRRQVKFTKWSLPSCPDGSTKGDCCKQGPHVMVSKTGYAKKLDAFCGPEAPKFEKSDFEKGKARWLVVYNNTGSSDDTQLEMESPTIGYRKSAAYDQLHYGSCVCGLKKNKRPKEDPSSSGNRVRRSPAKKKQLKKNKSKNTGRVKKVKKTKKKQRKSKNKNKNKKSSRTNSKQIVDESDKRVPLIWPWLASVTINGEVSCSAHIISPRIVITVTKCFPTLESASGSSTSKIADLNNNKDKIVVIGQDEKDVGTENDWYEEQRPVEEILVHPDCNPETAPQFCVVAIILSENFTMDINKPYRPRPSCMTCQVDDYNSRLLKGVPFLVGYGLQPSNNGKIMRSGSYKAPERVRDYIDPGACVQSGISTRETYCVKRLGEMYRCDTGPVTSGQPGVRDYGSLLINRVGRSGYKIMFQVIMLLWDFNCGQSGQPAEYIPMWPSLSWMTDLMTSRDKPCTKLVRKSDWTRGHDGYYTNGNKY